MNLEIINHILLAIMSFLIFLKSDKPNEKIYRYLWLIAAATWCITVFMDVVKLVK